MTAETVQYIDGTTVTVEVNRLGFRRSTQIARKHIQIARKHIPINSLTVSKADNSMTITGNIDLAAISESCLATIPGLDLDKLDGKDAARLYKTYFEADVMGSLGQSANPN